MKKKVLLISALALAGLFTLASCGNSEELDNLKKEVEALKADKDALTKEKSNLSNEKAKLEEEKNKLADDKAKLEADNSSLNNALKEDESKLVSFKNGNYFTVKYVDFIGNETAYTYLTSEYNNVLDALKEDFTVAYSESQYGTSINGINNSFIDSNWYISIYENGQYASTGIDGLEINPGDEFTFKHECWNTVESGFGSLDSYDVLVDKAIYNYYDNVLPKRLENVDRYDGSTYWDSMALYKLINTKNSYDSNLYELGTDKFFNENFESSFDKENYIELSGNNYFKYYFGKRLFTNDFTEFKTKYQKYLDTLTEYSSYGEYFIPFNTGAAKTLGLNLNDAIKTTAYRADTTYGTDGLAWELAGLACYNTLDDNEFTPLSFSALDNENVYSKDVTLSSMILPYAASNKSFRLLENENHVDGIEYLFDNFYDEVELKFDTEKLESDMSSNQIYAALVAYKVQRDTKNATNLFE